MVEKVVCVLVTYNPEMKLLRSNLEAILPQVAAIIVVNNSKTPLEELEGNEKVKVIELGCNEGIAKAQNIGMEYAFSNGADFVLQMDQDSTPSSNMVIELVRGYNFLSDAFHKIGLIAPSLHDRVSLQVLKCKKEKPIVGTPFLTVDYAMSSGSLIPVTAYNVAGGVNGDLFIDAVDCEYCWRLRKHGFSIVKCPAAILSHNLGQGVVSFLGIELKVPSPIRHYFQYRNILLLTRKSYVPVYWKVTNFFKLLLRIFMYPFVLDDWKLRFKFMFMGIHDAIFDYWGPMEGKKKRHH